MFSAQVKEVVVCAVPFSDNLGDGVIAQGMRELVLHRYPGANVTFLDIAGREKVTLSSVRSGSMYHVFQRLPGPLRSLAVLVIFCGKYLTLWRTPWRRKLQAADMVIIGGGHLFSDVSLNFPLKLWLLSLLIRGKRSVIFGVGVSSAWSLVGRMLARSFFRNTDPSCIVVRDDRSAANMVDLLRTRAQNVVVAPDVAFAIEPPGVRGAEWDVGLCVSDTESLKYNQKADHTGSAASDAIGFFSDMYKGLAHDGTKVLLFVNGAAEDIAIARQVVERLAGVGLQARLVVPKSSQELVACIASCRSIIAHRMHANIVAFRCGIPSVGIEWDPKVRSFFESVGRDAFIVPADASVLHVLSVFRGLRPVDLSHIQQEREKLFSAAARAI